MLHYPYYIGVPTSRNLHSIILTISGPRQYGTQQKNWLLMPLAVRWHHVRWYAVVDLSFFTLAVLGSPK